MSTLKVNTLQTNSGSGFNIDSPLESIPSIDVTGGAVFGGGINVTGVVTATSFSGSGANLTGLAATANVTTSSLVVIGVSTVAAGTTAAPSITPTGDSDTGIFFPSADTIAFGEGGSEALRIDSSGNLKLSTAATSILNSSGNKILNQTGSILQVVSATKTDSFSSSAAAFTDITGMSATLTPSSSSNKVLIIVSLIVSGDTWGSQGVLINLVRGSTNLAQGTSGSSSNSSFGYNSWSDGIPNTQGNYASIAFNFLDSPGAATSTTYKLQGRNENSPTYGFMVNRQFYQNALGFSSTITLLEVAA